MKLTELQKMRLPILEARAKNRAKDNKTKAATEEMLNKKLRRLNLAIQAGIATDEALKASEKILS